MKKTRYTDEQIVEIVRESQAHGIPQTAKKYQVSEQTIYIWKRKFGTMVRNPVHWIHRSVFIRSTLPGGLDPGFRSHWIHLRAFARNGGSNGVESFDLT